MSPTRGASASSGVGRSVDPAEQAWALLWRFVESHNRHGALAEALGFRLGAGRGKILFRLRDGAMTLGELAEATPWTPPMRRSRRQLEAHGLVDADRTLMTDVASSSRLRRRADAIATADAILLRPPDAMSSRIRGPPATHRARAATDRRRRAVVTATRASTRCFGPVPDHHAADASPRVTRVLRPE